MKKIVQISVLVTCIAASISAAEMKDIEEMNDGSKKIVIDRVKGVKTIIDEKGVKSVFDLNGKTPYGETIDPELVRVQANPVDVVIKYEPSKSDDILADDMRIFFDELIRAMTGKFSTKQYTGKSVLLVVSYCRFGEVGYCYKKPKDMVIVATVEGKEDRVFRMIGLEMKKKEKRFALAEKVLSWFDEQSGVK